MRITRILIWIMLVGIVSIVSGALTNAIAHPTVRWSFPDLPSMFSELRTQAQSFATSTESEKSVIQPTYLYRLRIPAINVNANVHSVGRAASGNMAVPKSFRDVGWYRQGARPGDSGSVVMTGHIDNALALPGVFAKLSRLEPGDAIYIDDFKGNTWKYVVMNTEAYPYDDAPVAEIFSQRYTTSKLHLITCSGDWQQAQKSYSDRLVIYAELVSD